MNYRLIHSATEVIAVVEDVGVTSTPHEVFTGTLAECRAEVVRLGLKHSDGVFPSDPLADRIKAAEEHVLKWFTPLGVIALQNRLLEKKDANTLDPESKLVAVYTWMKNIETMGISGQLDFPNPPYTFDEVLAE
jgi:hypothetical protein